MPWRGLRVVRRTGCTNGAGPGFPASDGSSLLTPRDRRMSLAFVSVGEASIWPRSPMPDRPFTASRGLRWISVRGRTTPPPSSCPLGRACPPALARTWSSALSRRARNGARTAPSPARAPHSTQLGRASSCPSPDASVPPQTLPAGVRCASCRCALCKADESKRSGAGSPELAALL